MCQEPGEKEWGTAGSGTGAEVGRVAAAVPEVTFYSWPRMLICSATKVIIQQRRGLMEASCVFQFKGITISKKGCTPLKPFQRVPWTLWVSWRALVVDAWYSAQESWKPWSHKHEVHLPGVGAAPLNPGSELWGTVVSLVEDIPV